MAQVWRRTKKKDRITSACQLKRKNLIAGAGGNQAKEVLAEADMVTVIDDREGDIYEKWARLPDARTHLLTRASRDRSLADGGRLFPTLAGLPTAHQFVLDLPARPGKRGARTARMAVRFGRIRIRRPQACSDRMHRPSSNYSPSKFANSIHHPAMAVCWRLLTHIRSRASSRHSP